MSIINLTEENFEKEVLDVKGTVLVDFHAKWCMPCKAMSPVLDEMVGDGVDFKVCKLDIDEAMKIARKYRVMSVPTFLVFKDGEKVTEKVGGMSKEEILELVK